MAIMEKCIGNYNDFPDPLELEKSDKNNATGYAGVSEVKR